MTSDMRTALTDYLRLRRGLGFSLCRGEKLLVQFLDYLDERGRADFTVDDALAWAKLSEPASPGWLGGRLTVVRGFAAYLHCLDSSVPAIPPGLLPGRGRRAVPYLYSDEDLVALLRQTETLQTPLRAATMRTLVGLLAVTGIRLSEALAVDDGDFDVDAGGAAGAARQVRQAALAAAASEHRRGADGLPHGSRRLVPHTGQSRTSGVAGGYTSAGQQR
jgi:integrase